MKKILSSGWNYRLKPGYTCNQPALFIIEKIKNKNKTKQNKKKKKISKDSCFFILLFL